MSQERLLSVLRAPHISEKATNNAEKSNTVVLKVALDANKAEIAAAVAQLFEVKVDSVRTVVVKGKTKRRGNKMGLAATGKSLCNFSRRPKLGLRGQCRVIGGN